MTKFVFILFRYYQPIFFYVNALYTLLLLEINFAKLDLIIEKISKPSSRISITNNKCMPKSSNIRVYVYIRIHLIMNYKPVQYATT